MDARRLTATVTRMERAAEGRERFGVAASHMQADANHRRSLTTRPIHARSLILSVRQ